MKNSKVLFLDLVNQIKIDESVDEIQSMAYILLEKMFSISRTDILAEMGIRIGNAEEEILKAIIQRINSHEPIQYILGETDFYGRKFTVNSSVLIPRPETEELVRLVVEFFKSIDGIGKKLTILDIGTGSGCIPITLAIEIPGAEVFATDVSAVALGVARENAKRLNAQVRFFENDILRDEIPFRDLMVVVSNPPYIALSEKECMRKNVLGFEPHLALFVRDDDPLLFYRVIAEKAKRALRSKGLLAVEINERFGKDVGALFTDCGFKEVEVIKDLFGKERIVKGILP